MIKIIQFSDCHLLADKTATFKVVNPYHALSRVCTHITHKHSDALAILMTGDLSQDGSTASYHHLIQLTQAVGIPAYALPGNHDNWSAMQQMESKGLQLEKKLQLGNWEILLLYSAVNGHIGGHLTDAEQSWLDKELCAPSESTQLIATHHEAIAPRPDLLLDQDWLNAIGINNPSSLINSLSRPHRVKLLLHGHVHQARHHRWDSIDCYATPSTWRQFSPKHSKPRLTFLPPAYRVIELGRDGHHRSWVEFV